MDKITDSRDGVDRHDYNHQMTTCLDEMRSLLDKYFTPEASTSRAMMLGALVGEQSSKTIITVSLLVMSGFGMSTPRCDCSACKPKAKA